MKSSDSKENSVKPKTLLERLQKSSLAPAALVGAFTSFADAAFGARPEPQKKAPQNASLVQINLSGPQPSAAPTHFEIEYSQALVLGIDSAARAFRRSLSGIAVDPKDRICALGDGQLCILDPEGNVIRRWSAPEGALCVGTGSDEKIYFGLSGRVEIYSATGARLGGFAASENGKPASVTAVKPWGQEILVADAAARCIHRYDLNGKQIGDIGTQNKTGGFMLPNRSLDFAVDSGGVVYATDSGRHRVSSWKFDGTPAGYFGRFGLAKPEDFVGCCNPVNLAIAPDGKIVTAEKVIARVKVYNRDGKLLSLIGPEHFDPKCIHLHLAVDSKGRIIVADPVRLQVKVFSPSAKSGNDKNV